MKKVNAEIAYLEVLSALDMDCMEIEPCKHSGSIPRSCFCYVLRNGLGYNNRAIADEIGWKTEESTTAALRKIRRGFYDQSPHLAGLSATDFCDNIIRGLSVRYDGVRIIPVGYGHTPLG